MDSINNENTCNRSSNNNNDHGEKSSSIEVFQTEKIHAEKSNENPEQNSQWNFTSLLQNPFMVLFFSFLFAWIYAILPDLNYWFYYYVKNQLWATLTLIECTELQTINIPDLKERSYFTIYIVGFFSTLLLYCITYFASSHDDSIVYITALSVCTPVLFIYLISGIDCFMNPEVQNTQNTPKLNIFKSEVDITPRKSSFLASLKGFSVINNKRRYRTIFAAVGYENEEIIKEDQHLPEISIIEPDPSFVGNPMHSGAPKSMINEVQFIQSSTSSCSFLSPSTWYHLKYYFPRYWNLIHFKEMNLLRNYDRRIIWFYTTCYSIIFCVNYIFLEILTINFRKNTNYTTGIYLFIFFIIGTTFLRLCLKAIGSILDSMKKLSISMYFLAELACVLFYYTFYRVLFRSIDSLALFFIFQFLHLSSEWLLYVFRTSDWFFMKSEAWIEYYWKEDVYWSWLIQKPRFTNHEWQRLMTLDYGIRVVILISSTYSIILLLVTIQYVPWIRNDLQQDTNSFQFTMLLLCLALILESINAYIMNEIYFKPKKLDAIKEVKCCFQNISFGILSLFIGCNLFINPVFAFTSDNRFR